MKKYLSLVLVSIMILAAFSLTSCEAVMDVFDEILQDVGLMPTPARTTITEEEWANAFKVSNYTLEGAFSEQELYIVTDGSFLKYRMRDGEMEQEMAVDINHGCMLAETPMGWLGDKNYSFNIKSEQFELANLGFFPEIAFEELEYNNKDKFYTYNKDDAIYVMYFEDGLLTKVNVTPTDSEEGYILVTNVGKNKIDIPGYTIVSDGIVEPSKAGKDVVTTITEEQLLGIWDMKNYTINAYMPVIGLFTEMTEKMTETACEYSSKFIMYGSEHVYYTISDGYMYMLDEDENGKYVATDKQPVGSIIGNLFGPINGLNMEMLTYDEEGRYYTITIDYNLSACLFFENGQLVQVVLVVTEGDVPPPEGASDIPKVRFTEVVIIISDVGTTVVDLPEFTFDENLE